MLDNVQVPGRNSSGETSQGLVLVVFSVKHVLESICQMFALDTSVVMVKKYVNLFAFTPTVEMYEKGSAVVFFVFLVQFVDLVGNVVAGV